MNESSTQIMQKVVDILKDKLANKVEVINISEMTIIADYFVIANGTSTTHTKGLADEVEFKLQEKGVRPDHIEGFDGAQWIAMDYTDILVHVFYKETRETYNLEKLWADGESVDINTLL